MMEAKGALNMNVKLKKTVNWLYVISLFVLLILQIYDLTHPDEEEEEESSEEAETEMEN